MTDDADVEQQLDASLAPGWLFTPPISRADPPIAKRYRTLPTHEPDWSDFERLCARLLELTEVEGDQTGRSVSYPVGTRLTRLYGTAGQKQDGIDVFSRDPLALGRATSERNVVSLQSKRIKKVTKAKFEEAVAGFRRGKWADKTRKFIYATSDTGVRTELADVIETQAAALAELGIDLVVWDREAMSDLLRERPRLVDDFFGRVWVTAYCGQGAADELGTRLDANRVSELRSALREIYGAAFAVADSGQLLSLHGGTRPPSLDDRFVTPDLEPIGVLEQLATPWNQAHPSQTLPRTEINTENGDSPDPSIGDSAGGSAGGPASETSTRSSGTRAGDWHVPTPWGASQVGDPPREDVVVAHEWLGTSERQIVVGDPGTGKSTALRYMVLDLLSDTPRWTSVATRWGDRLPIWLPFHYFTQRVAANSGPAASVVAAIRAWFEQLDFGHLMPLVEDALADDRLLLVVDGLDEWATPEAGEAAAAALETFVTARRVAIVLSARPYALSRVTLVGQWQAARLAPLSAEQQHALAVPLFAQAITSNTGPTDRVPTDERSTRDESEASDTAASEDQTAVTTAVQKFLSEVQASADLRSMAAVPLFLVLLAQLRISTGAELPPRRFDVFNEAVRLLVTVHRSRRVVAANVAADRRSTLDDTHLRMILAQVAYAAQERGDLRAIDDSRLRSDLLDALMSDDVLAMPRPSAITLAAEIADIAEGDVGLLVRLGPGQVGFIHRSLHEHLASEYLADRPTDDERVNIIRARAGDARWREVILGTLWATTSPARKRQIVEAVRTVMAPAPNTTADTDDTWTITRREPDTVESIAAAELVAEMVFGRYQVPGGVARDLAAFLVDRIERHPLLSHRSALLRHFVAGADDAVVGPTVTRAVGQWAVDINPPFAGMIATLPRTSGLLLDAAATDSTGESDSSCGATTPKPPDDETTTLVLDCIFAAMTDLKPDLAWAAATSLQAIGSDSAPDHKSIRELARQRLYAVIDNPTSASGAAAAMTIACLWWPHDKATRERVEWHRSSQATALRLTVLAHLLGVLERAVAGNTTGSDDTSAADRRDVRGRDGDAADDNELTSSEVQWLRSFLNNYWSGHPDLQSRILREAVTAVVREDTQLAASLADFMRRGRGSNLETVWTIALHAFAQETAIANVVAEILATEEHAWPALRLGYGLEGLATAYAPGTPHNELIAEAIETRLEQFDQRHNDMLLFHLSSIDQGPQMRRVLLDAIATPGSQPHWAARALHSHFGDDPGVRDALATALAGPAAHASHIAVVALEVLGAEPARVRLLELLRELHDGIGDDPTRRRFARTDIIASALGDCVIQLSRAERDSNTAETLGGGPRVDGSADASNDVVEQTCAEAISLLANHNDFWHGDAQFNLAIRTAICPSSRAILDHRAQSTPESQRAYRSSPDRYLSGLLYAAPDYPKWRHDALQRTLARLRVPPASIRYDLNRILATTPVAPHITLHATAGWADEAASEVKSIASLAYHRALLNQQQTGAIDVDQWNDAVAYLAEVGASYGHDHEERRRAAWVGMCVTRTWRQMVGVTEPNTGELTTVSLQGTLTGPDTVLLHELGSNWVALRQDFGDDLFNHIKGSEFDTAPAAIWDALATVARHFPAIEDELRHLVADDPALLAKDSVLHWFLTDPTRTRQEATEAVVTNIRTTNNLRDLAVLIAQDPQHYNLDERALIDLVASRFATEPAEGGFGNALLETLAVLQPAHPAVQELWAGQERDIKAARDRRAGPTAEAPNNTSPSRSDSDSDSDSEMPRPSPRIHPQTLIAVTLAAAPPELVPQITTSLLRRCGTTDDTSMYEASVIRHARRRLTADPAAAHNTRQHAADPTTAFTDAVQLATLMTTVPRADADPVLVDHCLHRLGEDEPPILIRDLTLNAAVSAETALLHAATRMH